MEDNLSEQKPPEQAQPPQQGQQIQIEIDDATAQGVYCNLAMIGHSEREL